MYHDARNGGAGTWRINDVAMCICEGRECMHHLDNRVPFSGGVLGVVSSKVSTDRIRRYSVPTSMTDNNSESR